MNEQISPVINFEKYKSRTKDKPDNINIIGNIDHPKDMEAGFTHADYDDHSQAPGMTRIPEETTKQPKGHMEPWMTSFRVILLIEYLRKHSNLEMILYEREGRPGLRFKPGLNAADMVNGRAHVAMNAFNLLQDSADDLKSMIINDIDVPLLIHIKSKSRNVK